MKLLSLGSAVLFQPSSRAAYSTHRGGWEGGADLIAIVKRRRFNDVACEINIC